MMPETLFAAEEVHGVLNGHKSKLLALERQLKYVIEENKELSEELKNCQRKVVEATEELNSSRSQPWNDELEIRQHYEVVKKERDDLIDLLAQREDERRTVKPAVVRNLERERNVGLVKALKAELVKTEEIVSRRDHQLSLLSQSYSAVQAELMKFQAKEQQWKQKEELLQGKLAEEQARKEEVGRDVQVLQKESKELKNREIELEGRLRDAIEVANVALSEKDRAIEAEMESRMKCEEAEVGGKACADHLIARAEEQLEFLQRKFRSSVEELRKQLMSLEEEKARLVEENRRLVEEKKATETNQSSAQLLKPADQIRIEEHILALESSLKESREKLLAEQRQFLRAKDELEDKLALAQKNLIEVKNQLLIKEEEVESLKKQSRGLKSELSEVEMRRRMAEDELKRNLVAKEEELDFVRKEHEIKLASTQSSSFSSVVELNKMLAEQQKISLRWKEEAELLARKSQERISDLKKEMKQLKEEKSQLLRQLQMRQLEAELKSELLNGQKDLYSFEGKLDQITRGLNL